MTTDADAVLNKIIRRASVYAIKRRVEVFSL
jgi:hypothetical protein